ncbi:hypothetical protein FB566_1694 [Stackebrandtia endophytica]|uniref:Uncharacterized protein n=1 Tax=Stackebrandtia endophytica TaxID=1496996 RepID=A0A543AUA9_9ACTN|nr:hypothetical protein [Stackebrandtia endophytica]TQL76173.1 hypothetical protein FB566_1694 [Stackebrandtia endophytica]
MYEERMARAKTPQTRASIRRWSLWSDFYFGIGVLLVIAGITFIAWSVNTERHDGPVFWGGIVVAVVLVGVCVGFGSHASSRLSEALWAEAHVSIGTVEKVVKYSTEGPDLYDVVVNSSLTDSPFRREITGQLGPTDVGDQIRFKHHTLDPDDLGDVLFDGWHRRGRPHYEPSWRSHQRSADYADAHVSVGRVDEVTSYLGIPGIGASTGYRLMVSVEQPGSVTLRRHIDLDDSQLCSSGPKFRSMIRVRHNTLDPEDLSDAVFDGWPGEAKGP